MKNKLWLVPLGLALYACSPGIEPEPETKVLTAQTLYFDGFNSNETNLETQGLRVFGPGADLATDVEPEYITVDAASGKAWVTLQENNGIAEITLGADPEIAALRPLGLKDYSSGNRLDANDKDGVIGFFRHRREDLPDHRQRR